MINDNSFTKLFRCELYFFSFYIKLLDVTGSMENLMDETHEKIGSMFGKAEQHVESAEKTVEDKVKDITSTMPE